MANPAFQLLEPLVRPAGDTPQLTLARQIPAGRLVEISGGCESARLTAAVSIVLQAQKEGETAAWVQPRGGSLFPPDLHDSGLDLDSLVVVHAPCRLDAHAIPRAAELLLRSGGFGLVVLDLTESRSPADTAWQGRLLSLAREHRSRVVCLTDTPEEAASLGPLVALRVEARRARAARGRFRIRPYILKNKLGLPIEATDEFRRAPWGTW